MNTVDVLERAIKQLEELKAGAFAVPYEPGVGGGDHWYLFAQDEAVAYVTANDGSDEEFREPTARLIAALSRTVDPMIALLRLAVEFAGITPNRYVDAAVPLALAVLGEVEQ